ncbi:site-specific integrase [Lichenibacterium minor]|uniref:Site-specific integrase n=1 Tax=Lichenibacterium minor TaxID=2316528 RepID=A0A4Q2UG12_9HYPH|nr:site-specific integrase [Lichenibacterium minor]RYC34056.1 site-specific integrase [Lichenibacterium minor]
MLHSYRLRLHRGRFALYWREDGRSRRYSLGTTEKVEAEVRADAFIRAMAQARAPTITIAEVWERYRERLKGRPAYTTMAYEWKHLLSFFGDLRAYLITEEACRRYIEYRRGQGRKDGTILTELNRLSNALNYAVKAGLLDRAPVIVRPRAPPPRDRFLTKAEARTFLDGIAALHVRLFCVLALATAARREAILGLTWDRIDMGRRRLHLTDPKAPETAKSRAIVPINDRLHAELLAARQRDHIAMGSTAFVVQYRGGRVASLKTALAQTCRRSGVEGVTAHVFRHTAAVWMAEGGVPMEEIAQFLGHRDVTVTRKVYARFSPEYLRKAAESLDF